MGVAVWGDPQLRLAEPGGSGARLHALSGLSTRSSSMMGSTRSSTGKNWAPTGINKGKTVTLLAPPTYSAKAERTEQTIPAAGGGSCSGPAFGRSPAAALAPGATAREAKLRRSGKESPARSAEEQHGRLKNYLRARDMLPRWGLPHPEPPGDPEKSKPLLGILGWGLRCSLPAMEKWETKSMAEF
jgi:hypothetical protein